MTQGEKWILFFEECGRGDTDVVGGKCANLGEMCKMGIPVPPGFAITTEVYNRFLELTNVGNEMKLYLKKFPDGPKTIEEFDEVGKTIDQLITSKEMPKELMPPISEAYDTLCKRLGLEDVSVAVRSSGVAEDMPTASFAGQYDSYLNVIGKEELFEKIVKCWASAFTPRCVSYRIHHGLGVLAGSISVGVQKMVNAQAAGVGFTANPNTGNRNRIVIEGNWGAGESVVQGLIKPDRFEVDKETLEIIESQINQKTKQTAIIERGVVEKDIPEDKQCAPCLEDREVHGLAEFAKNAEVHYGIPLDIEWAVDRDLEFPNNIFLVQARPITAMAEEKDSIQKIIDMACTRLFPVR